MAGFAVMIAPGSAPQEVEAEFQNFLHLTANFKQLEIPATNASGRDCFAAKLDSPAAIHPGIIYDHQTGSWLLAAGTVVALEGDNHPSTVLHTLLQSYINNGEKALESFDGHFSLVIYNGREESLSVISDPIGLFSIFYGRRGSQIFISSSALAVAKQIQSQADVLAVEYFLRAGRLEGSNTLWRDVKRLVGGNVLKVTNGRIEEIRYWSPACDTSISRLPIDQALDQSVAIFSKTFSRLLSREGKIWVDLTGGFDSRLVAMFVAKSNIPFITYCMGPEDSLDVQLSRKISKEMNWEYVHSQLPEQWDPDQFGIFDTALGSGDGRASLLRFAVTMRGFSERNVFSKTNVMGVGGESFRGFRWQIEKWNIGKTTKLNLQGLLDSLVYASLPLEVMRHDRTGDIRQEMLQYIQQLLPAYSEYPNSSQIDRLEIDRDANHGGAYLSASTRIQRSLAPLCFKALVNFAFSLNYRWKLPRYHVFVRTLLERENKRLASLETTTGGPAFPIRVTNVQKFWPLWRGMANRAVVIGSKKLLGKGLQPWPQSNPGVYPLPAWRKSFHKYAHSRDLLNFDAMYSKGLYKPSEFAAFVNLDDAGSPHSSEFLDRVISIEMCMRAVGSSID